MYFSRSRAAAFRFSYILSTNCFAIVLSALGIPLEPRMQTGDTLLTHGELNSFVNVQLSN
jgi:hypothetical protein